MRAAFVVGPCVIALAIAGCSSSSSPGGAGDGGTDSGAGTDSGGGHDSGGTDSGGVTVQGCAPASFVDEGDAAAMRTITFPMDFAPVQFNPPCMKIKAGQSVTWNGSFTNHPLEAMGGDTPNPIVLVTSGTTTSVTFTAAGTFGFDCANHPSIMKGAILVVP